MPPVNEPINPSTHKTPSPSVMGTLNEVEAKKKHKEDTELTGTLQEKVEAARDPYKNYQDVVIGDHVETDRIRAANMRAKEAEINKEGSFTKEEADNIKRGLGPAKQAEVDAQVMEGSPEEREKLFSEITAKIAEFSNNDKFGWNARRAQLRQIRQMIQDIEVRMDRGY